MIKHLFCYMTEKLECFFFSECNENIHRYEANGKDTWARKFPDGTETW